MCFVSILDTHKLQARRFPFVKVEFKLNFMYLFFHRNVLIQPNVCQTNHHIKY